VQLWPKHRFKETGKLRLPVLRGLRRWAAPLAKLLDAQLVNVVTFIP